MVVNNGIPLHDIVGGKSFLEIPAGERIWKAAERCAWGQRLLQRHQGRRSSEEETSKSV